MLNWICLPNVDEISESTANLLQLLVCENKRPPYWTTSGFDFDLFVITGMTFCVGVQNLIEIGQRTVDF